MHHLRTHFCSTPVSPAAELLSSLTALLTKPEAASSNVGGVRDLMQDLLNLDGAPTNSRGEKTLLPIHFVSCIRGTHDSEETIHSGKGLNLILQTSNKRVTPEKLSQGQWIGANSRILGKLMSSGKLSPAQIVDYLDYSPS